MIAQCIAEPDRFRLVLVRDVANDVEGIIDRQWAYCTGTDTLRLPERFDEARDYERDDNIGPKVPPRFHAELRKLQ